MWIKTLMLIIVLLKINPEYYDKLIEPKRECAFNCSQDDLYKFEFKKNVIMIVRVIQ